MPNDPDEPHANNQDAMNVTKPHKQPKTVLRSSGLVRMRPLARQKVLAKLPTAYCQRILEKYCVFTGTKINLCLAEGDTRKEAWENAAAS